MATRIENMTLEERVFKLLYPYRNECFESTVPEEKLEQISVSDRQERKARTVARKSLTTEELSSRSHTI
jgi:hypothetical protein